MLKALIHHGPRPFRPVSLGLLLIAAVISSLPAQAAPASPPPASERRGQPPAHTLIFNDGRRIRPTKVIPPDQITTSDGIMTPGSAGTGVPLHALGDPNQQPVEEVAPVNLAYLGGNDTIGVTAIIGSTDTRTQISNTTVYPYRTIVRITSSVGLCTGFMISSNTVATAGHCLYGNYGAGPVWATNIRVYPGQNGAYQPYGSCGARWASVSSPWQQAFNRDYDYGAIKLDCSVGFNTGTLGLKVMSNPTGLTSSLIGYPGDKADQNGTKGTTQWIDTNTISKTFIAQVLYPHDMLSGQSGGPVYYRESSVCSCYAALAINTWHPYGSDANLNRGTRITQQVYDDFQFWIRWNT